MGRTHEAGEIACWCIFPPGFGDRRSSALSRIARNKGAVFPLQASFSSKRVQQDEHDPNATCSTTIQALDLCDKSFGTYGGWAWSFLELLGAGPSPKPGASALPFPRPFITSAACISRDFLTVKRSTLLHSKTCAFRFVILMDRNDSYKQLPDDFRWQGQN